MKTSAWIACAVLAAAASSMAAEETAAPAPLPPASEVDAAVAAYREAGTVPPVLVEGTLTRYPYGHAEAKVVCPVLEVCDVSFDPGETITSVAVGDSERWRVIESTAGTGASKTTHAVIKALAPGLRTNMLAYSDRGRTYALTLIAPAEKGKAETPIRRVAFYYPDDTVTRWQSAEEERTAAEAEAANAQEGFLSVRSLDSLNWKYTVVRGGKLPWTPDQIFDDGAHTYVRFPEVITSLELPALLVVGGNSKEAQLPNFRVINERWYKVDGVFRELRLSLGVGASQKSVSIQNKAYPKG